MNLPADVLAEIDTWLVSAHDSWAWQSTCRRVRDAVPPARPPAKRALPPTFMQAVEGPAIGRLVYSRYDREELRRGADLLRIMKAGRVLSNRDYCAELFFYANGYEYTPTRDYPRKWVTARSLVPEICDNYR